MRPGFCFDKKYLDGYVDDLDRNLFYDTMKRNRKDEELVADLMLPLIKSVKKNRVYDVKFEEVKGDLEEGVKSKLLQEMPASTSYNKQPAKKLVSKPRKVSNLNGAYCLEFESYCKHADMVGGEAWRIFYQEGLKVIKSGKCQETCKYKSFSRITQDFTVSVCGKNSYLQLICIAEKVRYNGCWYKKDDIVTLFVEDTDYPLTVSVRPQAEHTFVPLLPDQELQLVVDLAFTDVDWKINKNSSLIFTGREFPNSPKDLSLYFFECVKPPEFQESIFVANRTVFIPTMFDGNTRKKFPIINPDRTSVICSQNIDGFIVRSKKNIFLRIEKGCPIKPIYIMEKPNFSEMKLEIEEFRQNFILEREQENWVVKAD